jgi:carboxypeptidase T
MKSVFVGGATLLASFLLLTGAVSQQDSDYPIAVEIVAKTKAERQYIAGIIPIDEADGDIIRGHANPWAVDQFLKQKVPFRVLATKTFPPADQNYHDYDEMVVELKKLEAKAPEIVKLYTFGLSNGYAAQGYPQRELLALRISDHPTDEENEPGVIFLGQHHAREHLSSEVPLFLAQYLVDQYGKDPKVTQLVDEREIWIAPIINPDGSEWDIRGDKYHMWRKNLAIDQPTKKMVGVDLNRNYGFGWGGPGSSGEKSSDIYRGPEAFSEPETRAVRDFVRLHAPHTKVLLTFHTYSELILYPWGHKDDPISVEKDRKTFETMAQTMAKMNGYKPEKSSELYLASGDTTDWAYGELGIFAFTFELFPKSNMQGGFYPGDVIQKVAQNNLAPALYLIEHADDPYRVLDE